MFTLILLAVFAFFNFTEKGRKIYATRTCALAILAVSAWFVVAGALSLSSYLNPVALIEVGLWGYLGSGAFKRARPLLGRR